MNKKRIIFISHDASRTGAPMLLLNLVKWITNNHEEVEVTVLLVKDGDLNQEFKKHAKTFVLTDYANVINPYFLLRNKYIRDYVLFSNKWDLIFSNTIVNGKILEKFKNKNTPIISYIHELKESILDYNNQGRVAGTLEQSNYFFCGSTMVKETLEKYFNVSPLKTAVVNSFISFNDNLYDKDNTINNQLRNQLNIPEDTMVVGMLGTFDKRKGYDLFIETARKMTSNKIHFIWVGANEERVNKFLDKSTIKDLNISLIPPSRDYLKYYHMLDIFFLSSREDPYPMVMVEASAYGIPIICFKGAGGTQEFIDDKVGFVVPFEDTEEVVRKINFIKEYHQIFINNQYYIKERSIKSHDIELNAEIIYNKIKEFC